MKGENVMAFSDGSMSPADIAAVTGNGSNNNGWGGDGSFWIIVLFLIAILGFGNGYGGNYGGGSNGAAAGAPYVVADVQRGFDHNGVINELNGISSAITSNTIGTQTALCNGFAGVNANMNAGFANAETAANARQIANMQQGFAIQTGVTGAITDLASQQAQCCCENRLATCQTQNIVQNEGNATRFADATNTRDIIEAINTKGQGIMDKLCQLELDGVKAQVEAKNDRIAELTTQLNMANLAASQTAQTEQIRAGQLSTMNNLVNELRSCPIPAQPVYGSQPIFTCPRSANPYGYGCNCGMA
jgi:hypothetical protein